MLKLTVAIPAYNVSAWLEGTLESVLACNSDEYEVLVIDDGSTDSTGDIARTFQESYPEKVHYVRKENGHYGSVVNRAIREARGLFLRILDGDDFIDSDGLAQLIELINGTELPDLILCDYREHQILEARDRLVHIDLPPGIHSVRAMDAIPDFGMHSAVFRTALLVEHDIRLTEGVPFTDQQYVLYPMPFVETIAFWPVEVYQYRLGVEGQSVSPENAARSVGAHGLVFRAVCDWAGFLDFEQLPSAVQDFIVFHIMRFASFHVKQAATALDSDSARRELRMLDGCIGSNPVLSQSDCRAELVKGYGLLSLCEYRFLPVWKLARNMMQCLRRVTNRRS